MSRTTDRERLLTLLAQTDGLSSARIKLELNLGDERYEEVRAELCEEGLAERYVCRGGGLRLTRKGEREISPETEAQSSVEREEDLYAPLVDTLMVDAPDCLAFDTSSLRKRGKWQNPDVTQISVETYPLLRRRRVMLTTYEVKQWGAWDVSGVFETASHARFAHDGLVVLEWTEKAFELSDPRLASLVRECQRFGVGLATLEPYYARYRLRVRLESLNKAPREEDVEEWLDYALTRRPEAMERFQKLMNESDKQLRGR